MKHYEATMNSDDPSLLWEGKYIYDTSHSESEREETASDSYERDSYFDRAMDAARAELARTGNVKQAVRAAQYACRPSQRNEIARRVTEEYNRTNQEDRHD
jgi:hypothetical protein